MTDEQMIRLLRAKAAELENRLRITAAPMDSHYLGADIALVAGLLADYMERNRNSQTEGTEWNG